MASNLNENDMHIKNDVPSELYYGAVAVYVVAAGEGRGGRQTNAGEAEIVGGGGGQTMSV